MDEMESLSHTKWECKYHVVFIAKCRRKVLYGELRLGRGIPQAGRAEESRIEEGHLLPDHVHMQNADYGSTWIRKHYPVSEDPS